MKLKITSSLFLLLALITGNSFVNAQKIAVTIGGIGTAGYAGVGGSGRYAQLNAPIDVTEDAAHNIYFVEQGNGEIMKISAQSGVISIYGGGGTSTADGIPATDASIAPNYLCIDAAGNIYFTTTDDCIKKINGTTGIITTIAGTSSTAGFSGDGGPATAALLSLPSGICLDPSGNIYFVDNNRIRKIAASTGIITTVAGNGAMAYTGDGGMATLASLLSPVAICTKSNGDVYFTDQGGQYIRKINVATGVISTYAGNPSYGYVDGVPATGSRLGNVYGICTDDSDDIIITDISCSTRQIDDSGENIHTICGSLYTDGYNGDGVNAINVLLNFPYGVHRDNTGTVYIADKGNHRIRKAIQLTHTPTFAYGKGQFIQPCPGVASPLSSPLAITDIDSEQTETWTILVPPVNGTLTGFPAMGSSMGLASILMPTGVYYTPSSTFTGMDSFKIAVSDGALNDTITIYASVQTIDPGTISGSNTICLGANQTYSSSSLNPYLGTWKVTNSNVTIDSFSGAATAATVGLDTVVYTYSASCPVTVTYPITVSPIPSAGIISGLDTVCVGSTITLSETIAGGLWSASFSAYYAAIDSISGVVTGLIYSYSGIALQYTTPAIAGCTATATKYVVVNAPVSAISGPGLMCTGDSTTINDEVVGGTWATSNDVLSLTSLGTGSMGVTAHAMTGGIDTIYYTNTNSCGTATASYTVNVNPIPDAGTISGPTTVCIGGTITLTESVTGGYWTEINTNAMIGYVGDVTGIIAGTDSFTYQVYSSGFGCSSTVGFNITIDSCPLVAPMVVLKSSVQIYPNPASAQINIGWHNINASKEMSLLISDVAGRELISKSISNTSSNGEIPVDVSTLKEGVYFLTVVAGSDKFTDKLLIIK